MATLIALIALGGATASRAADASNQCLARGDAAALVQAIAPDLLQAAARKCSATLPPDALLTRQSGALMSKYRRAAAGAWPGARRALQQVAGPEIGGMLEGPLAQSIVGPLLAPMFTQNVSAADCADLNTIVMMIEPLPAENLGRLFVAVYDMADRNRAADATDTGLVMPFHLCHPKQG
ncbi:hypothetical protein [Stakelama saccharophila]|uniref:Uncharacterized protein n=1 Tax=Stakelama saccharophila TaxID=3075605 RepID=A0ABZ0B593_9SPHN|nr:hypothetical protein [Stakelama sp. W311]WNO52543.1 hypothetical protein RPR59_08650 [Stakelama sp. W311]